MKTLLSLAAAAAAAVVVSASIAHAAPAKRPKVLVVGDASTNKAVVKSLKQEGFVIASGTAASMSDADVAAAASKAGAGIAVIGQVTTTADGPLRGARLLGARAEVTIRVVDAASRKSVITERSKDAGYGDNAAAAATAATTAAIGRAMGIIGPRMSARWPAVAPTAEGRVQVVIFGARGWASVLALVKHLAGQGGIDRAAIARLAHGRIVLRVDTKLTMGKVAVLMRGAQLPVGSVNARVRGGVVRVDLQAQDVSS